MLGRRFRGTQLRAAQLRADHPLVQSFVGYWDFRLGGANVAPRRVNVSDATVPANAEAPAEYGPAIQLSGSNDISVGNAQTLLPSLSGITFGCFAKFDSFTPAYTSVGNAIEPGLGAYMQMFVKSNGKLAAYTAGGGTGPSYDGTGANTLVAKREYLLIFRWSGSVVTCFVDGAADGSGSGGASPAAPSAVMYWGHDAVTSGRRLTGTIARPFVSDRAWSDDEVAWYARDPSGIYAPRRMWMLPAEATAGSTYNVTLTEAVTAADAAASAALFASALSEAATASDTITATGLLGRSVTEAASAADTIASAQLVAAAQAEAATAADSITTGGVVTSTLTETLTAADSLAALAALGAAMSDTVTVGDLVVSALAAVAAVAEAASLGDQQSTGPVVTGTMAEAVSAADAMQAAASLVAQIAEAASAGDVLTAAQQLLALLTETATAADSVAAAAPAAYSVSITELATALDQIVAALAGDSAFAAAVFRTARGTSTTRAVKGTARNSIRGYQ